MTSINAGFSSSLYADDVQIPAKFEAGRSETGSAYEYHTRHAPRRPTANSLMPIQRRQQAQSQSVPSHEHPMVASKKGENVEAYSGQVYGSSTLASQTVEANMSETIYERQMSNHNRAQFQKPPANFISNHASAFSPPGVKQADNTCLEDDYSQCTCCKCNNSGCIMRDPLTNQVSCRECNSNALRLQ